MYTSAGEVIFSGMCPAYIGTTRIAQMLLSGAQYVGILAKCVVCTEKVVFAVGSCLQNHGPIFSPYKPSKRG